MSNAYRKPEQVAEPFSNAQRVDLVSGAIQKLYEARGGLDIEAQIDVARINLMNARSCRLAEAARLKQDPYAEREKGERPIITVSEDRLHSREMTRLMELREFKRGLCRTQIQEALNRSKPRSLAELRDVLETAARDIDDVARMFAPQADESAAQAEFEAVLATAEALAKSGKLTPELSQALLEATKRQGRRRRFSTCWASSRRNCESPSTRAWKQN